MFFRPHASRSTARAAAVPSSHQPAGPPDPAEAAGQQSHGEAPATAGTREAAHDAAAAAATLAAAADAAAAAAGTAAVWYPFSAGE